MRNDQEVHGGHERPVPRPRFLAPVLLAVAATLSAGGPIAAPTASAQGAPRLVVGGSSARAGVHSLAATFAPDPFQLAMRVRGALHVADMRIGAGCRGYVSEQPDAILRLSGAAPFLRLFVRSDGDATLVVREPGGRFLCNDDASPGRNRNPMVDVYTPRPGQYDVWIGTHAADQELAATLFVTRGRTEP